VLGPPAGTRGSQLGGRTGLSPLPPVEEAETGLAQTQRAVFSADELLRIREFVKPDFADFLRALELTGTRPFSALATVTAQMVDWADETITFAEHKNEKKGKTRTIGSGPVSGMSCTGG
jgi:hypothetical protein